MLNIDNMLRKFIGNNKHHREEFQGNSYRKQKIKIALRIAHYIKIGMFRS